MHIIRPALKLFLVAAIATTLLAVTHALTLEPIATNNKIAQEKLMKEIFTHDTVFNEISVEKSGIINRVFEAIIGGELNGYIIELSPSGYGGTINMIVGISKKENVVAGMRVLRHKETPGLGALIVTDKFFHKYDGKKLAPLKVVRPPSKPRDDEIDAITAATISTRVVTEAVNEAIKWYQGSDLK